MITVHIIVDRVIIFIKRFNKCTILISIFRMLSATGLTAFAFQTNTTQHNIPSLFFVILREHLRIIPSWIIKKLTDVFIAVVCIGESFVQYFLQLLLFRFLRVKVFHSILIIQLLITFFNSIHFCLGLFSLHYRGNSKAKGLKYKTDSILSIYTQYQCLFAQIYNNQLNSFKMARNCEKAQGMLNRWWMMKRCLVNKQDDERPKGLRHIREINDLYECQKWRKQVSSKIIEKVEEIQNRARPENQIRTINDDINRLLRELYHWEIRIKELGGNDYRTIKNAKMYDAQGHEIPGFGGYRYFGAAKDLPGVKDVYRRQVPIAPEKTSAQIRKVIDDEYFGDSEITNQQLIQEEALEEEAKREAQLVEWIQANKKKIEQFFGGRQPQIDELIENIDNIEDFQVEVEQQMIEEQEK